MSYAPKLITTGTSSGGLLPAKAVDKHQDQYSRIWSKVLIPSALAGAMVFSTATGKVIATDTTLVWPEEQGHSVAEIVKQMRSVFSLNVVETSKVLRVSRQMIYNYQQGIEPQPDKKRRLSILAELANEWQNIDPTFVKSYIRSLQPEGKTLLDYLQEDNVDVVAVREILKRATSSDRKRRESLLASLHQGETLEARRDIAEDRKATGKPIYIADPDNPSKIVQVLPDGTRTRGVMVNRRFVPEA